jgi:uncharacterized protein (TIGR02646 family)
MKCIIKGSEPVEFTNWKNKENENWAPTYNLLSGDEKAAVFESLKKEQGYLCCYCEQEIETNDCHIEHFRPKDQLKFPELQLVYSNFHCSCQRNVEKGAPLHCGNSKGNWYTEGKLISPLDTQCEMRFKFTEDGQMLPFDTEDDAAKTTIDKLKLDIDKLNSLRESVIEPFLNLDGALTTRELEEFVQGYLIDKDSNNGRFNEFYTTIKYLFEK